MNELRELGCTTLVKDKILKLGGNRTSTLYLLNPTQRTVEKVEVDGCEIKEGPRCDWLVRAEDKVPIEEIYVELKGSDVAYAIEQIIHSIAKLSKDSQKLLKRCYVAYNRNPLTGSDVQKWKVLFKKRYNALFQALKDGSKVEL